MSDIKLPKVEQELFDVNNENLQKLASLFPSAVKDGQLDIDALKEELGQFEEVGQEKYELTWAGKQNAKKEARRNVLGKTLRYIEGDGVDEDTTQNLYIEGDNLEVLKLLRKNYYGKIKMIYIDPPYNTGSDFVYKDNFSMTQEELEQMQGERDEYGEKLQKNSKDSAKYHTNWLNMMYPRLQLAKDLLTEDGVIFISIDDNEINNLERLCNDIFGPYNRIGLMTIMSNPRGSQNSKFLSYVHEYIIMYAKTASNLELKGISKSEESLGEYNEVDENGRKYRMLGLRKRGGAWRKEDRPNMFYPIYVDPKTGKCSMDRDNIYTIEVIPKRPTGELSRWTWGKEKFNAEKHLLIGKKVNRTNEIDSWDIFRKDYIDSDDGTEKTTKLKTIWVEKEINYQNAKNEIKELFGNSELFDFPKPTYIVKHLLSALFIDEGDIILDFFSGSGTTAHACMKLNLEDNYNKRFILVQIPQEINKEKDAYKLLLNMGKHTNICELGKERIRRAGKKIKEEIEAENQQLKLGEEPKKVPDIGFKVFRVGETTLNWEKLNLQGKDIYHDYIAGTSEKDKLDFTPDFKNDLNVVYEIMLRQEGLPLTSKIEKLTDIGSRTYLVADSYLISLEEDITPEMVEKLSTLNPLPIKFVFRDSAFDDNIVFKDETFRRLNALIDKNTSDEKKTYTVEFI